MGRTKRLPPGDPGASTSNAAADVDICRSLEDLPEEALSNIASRLMVFSPPFERECHGVRTSIELASTCARLRRIVIGAWCQNLLKAPVGGGSKGKAKVKVTVSEEEVDAAAVAQLKEWCAQMGLKKGGKKAELQLRVLAAQKPESSSGIPPELKRFISSQNRARVTVTNAKKEYRVGEQELSLLPSEQRPNPIDPSYAPMRLYAVNDVLAAAKARFKGDAEWFRDSSRRAPKLTPDCQQALRLELARTGQPKRRAQVERAIKAHGLDPDEHRAAFQEYIETGVGSLDMIVRIINTGDQDAREAALRDALKAAGLPEDHATSCQLFRAYLVNAQGKGPAELVPMLQRQLAYEASRLEAATSALIAAGLDPATHLTTPPFMAHIKGGTGALASLVEAAQAAAGRSATATSALAAAGLNPADHMSTEPFVVYVRSGAGELGQLVAHAVLVAARGRIAAKLVAASLPAALAGAWELQPFVQAEATALRAAVSGSVECGAGGNGGNAPEAATAAAAAAPGAAAAASPPAAAAAAAADTTPAELAAAAAAPMQRRAAAIAALRAAGLLTAAAGDDEHDAALEGALLLEEPELNPYLMVPYKEDAVGMALQAGEAGTAAAAEEAEAERAEAAEARLRAAVHALAERLRVEAVNAQSAAIMEAAQQRQKQQLQLQKQAQERQAQQARTQQALQQRQAAVAAALARPAVASQGVRSVKQEALVQKAEKSMKQEPGVKKEAGVKLEGVKEEAGVKLEALSDEAVVDMGQRQAHGSKKKKAKQEEESARPARRSNQAAKGGGRRGRGRAASESEEEEYEASDEEAVSEKGEEEEEEEEEEMGKGQQAAVAVAYGGARRSTRAVRGRKRPASPELQEDDLLEEEEPAVAAGGRAKRGRKRTASPAQQEEELQQEKEKQGRQQEEEEEKARPAQRPKKRTAGGLCVCCGDGRATRQCEHACCEDCCPGPCKKHGC